jgi:hypothetical protein
MVTYESTKDRHSRWGDRFHRLANWARSLRLRDLCLSLEQASSDCYRRYQEAVQAEEDEAFADAVRRGDLDVQCDITAKRIGRALEQDIFGGQG